MPKQHPFTIPIAIVIAGALIAVAFYLVEKGHSQNPASPTPAALAKDVPPVTAADHIQGDVNAPVKIVEYIDLECPFCKEFDTTMRQIMAAYPGKVAWIIRNFPLQQLHPNAPKLALAAECVASLGGNNAYWAFKDSIFTQAPVNTFFDMTKLTATAQTVGVDGKNFDTCVAGGLFEDKITNEFNDAIAAGAAGTPFSVFITKNNTQVAIPGAQSFDQLKAAVDTALAK